MQGVNYSVLAALSQLDRPLPEESKLQHRKNHNDYEEYESFRAAVPKLKFVECSPVDIERKAFGRSPRPTTGERQKQREDLQAAYQRKERARRECRNEE